MALTKVLGGRTSTEIPENRYVGMKLGNEDYAELAKLLEVPPTIGGAALFKQMLIFILKAKGVEVE